MAGNEKKQRTISKRQSTLKKEFLEFLQENGLIQVACRKTGIGRQTYYRWLENDSKFSRDVNRSLRRGRDVGNDMAESVVMGKISEKDLGAAKFYLQNNDPRYMHVMKARARELRQNYLEEKETLELSTGDPKSKAAKMQALGIEYEDKLRQIIVEDIKLNPKRRN